MKPIDTNALESVAEPTALKTNLGSLKLSAVAAIAVLVFIPRLSATTDTLFNDSDDSYVSESVTRDLNAYSVSTITALHLETEGQGSDYADATSGLTDVPDSTEIAVAYGGGGDQTQGRAIVEADDITKNEDGDWIASTVSNSQYGYTYNVNCGSGEVEFDSEADGGYTGEGCTTYGYVEY